ncbi:multicopper oxidase [Polychaeton citri CBS 116435]|uniref:laccase n=1 Tax=Polychaeton citri CBS 116435 TaxID=1314669 RepID=A0A9P4USN5_9PEZI|nr:multicopper oxidase [Polychaeton citri CBS 116435]
MPGCVNGPKTRACWTSCFSIADDFDLRWPDTGRTRHYDWTIESVALAPDGFERIVLAVNGQYPGPTLYADWGDTVIVTLMNLLKDNGTTVHWHGMRMWDTKSQDGVTGLTGGPLAPGETKTYMFHATQYGTAWYHSHFDIQYGDGLLRPIVINGPSTANYDEDLGVPPITDWFHTPVATMARVAARSRGPSPLADNNLINGTMVALEGQTGGACHCAIMQLGKNIAFVSLDDHALLVMSADLVPVRPFWTHWLFLGIGQRYNAVVKANRSVLCGANKNNGNIKSISSYEGAPDSEPTSTGVPYTQSCDDPPASSLVPFWNSFVPNGPLLEGRLDTAVKLGVSLENEVIVKWSVNLSAMRVDWLTLRRVINGYTDFSIEDNIIIMPQRVKYYWIVQEVEGTQLIINIPHPIHLHGHDFYILGSEIGKFEAIDRTTLNYLNPPRRDTVMLPTAGWVVIAFQTDNPGAWLMHCHIAWHSEFGSAVQFLENATCTLELIDEHRGGFDKICETWNAYCPHNSNYHRGNDVCGI